MTSSDDIKAWALPDCFFLKWLNYWQEVINKLCIYIWPETCKCSYSVLLFVVYVGEYWSYKSICIPEEKIAMGMSCRFY